MLSLDKVKIYAQFDGDIDGWARSARDESAAAMSDVDWYLIDELLQGLAAVKAGVATASYAEQVEQRLLASTEDEATRHCLRALAKSRCPRDAA